MLEHKSSNPAGKKITLVMNSLTVLYVNVFRKLFLSVCNEFISSMYNFFADNELSL